MRSFLTWVLVLAVAGTLYGLAGCPTLSRTPTKRLTIISRSLWNASEPNLNARAEHGLYDPQANPDGWMIYDKPLPDVLDTIVIHHSFTPLTDGPRGIQDRHTRDRGFADIGYHFLVDGSGRVYEGRSLKVRGAHTHRYNFGTIGIVLMGNFDVDRPTPSQLFGLNALVDHLVDRYTITRLAGHLDFRRQETVCPGRHLEPLLPELAARLGLAFGATGYVAPSDPQPAPMP